jgi:hypothetical protein
VGKAFEVDLGESEGWGEEEEAMQKYRDPENAGHLRSRWT